MAMDKRRVVMTGAGAVTPVGNTAEEFWGSLLAGRSGIGPITRFDASQMPTRIAGEIKGFDPLKYIDKKDDRKLDRFLKYAVACAAMAVEDAGLKTDRLDATRFGVMVGSGIGGIETLLEQYTILMEKGPDRVSPFFVPMIIVNMASGLISMRFGAKGPNSSVVTACATGNHAIGDATRIIQRGDADVMIAGGAEAGIREPLVGGFDSMHALSRRNDDPEGASRPFDQGRDGFVPGEGAGALVLEELDHALARGATILAEIIGYGATADASHITLPAPGGIGAVRAARRALEKAGLEPDAIDHVNAHATSTPEGDKSELQAIRTLLGARAGDVPITANKSMLGHTLGAAGAIEAIITIQTIRHGCVPPTINLTEPDPAGEGLDLTPNTAARHDVEVALSNSFGFGGQNAALIIRRFVA
jgi:3-oxoacyl-[acyl-carrier-protein] synthase II